MTVTDRGMRRPAMRAVTAALLALGTIAAVMAPQAGASDGGGSARGNYTRSSAIAGTCRRGGFSVTSGQEGASGTFAEAVYSCATGSFTGESFTAKATCVVVTGHMAVISGNIIQGTGMFAGYPSIQQVVEDNSTPSAPPTRDRAVNRAFGGSPTCTPFPELLAGLQPVTAGDITVVAPA